jgi:excisionase family DNA binding protein
VKVDEPLLLPVRRAAQVLGCGRDHLYGLIKAGQVRCVRIGRRTLIPRRELELLIERLLATEEDR